MPTFYSKKFTHFFVPCEINIELDSITLKVTAYVDQARVYLVANAPMSDLEREVVAAEQMARQQADLALSSSSGIRSEEKILYRLRYVKEQE
ncbi:hypothetical protein GCM10027299_42330 [Larkinella ripae]